MGYRSVGQLRNLAKADGVYHLKDFLVLFLGQHFTLKKYSAITLIVEAEKETARVETVLCCITRR